MDRAKEKNFDKHVDIANDYYSVLKEAKGLRDDMKVFVLSHSDDTVDSYGVLQKRKIKTLGNMLDKYITIEGLFTYVLFCEKLSTEDDQGEPVVRYTFMTNDPTNLTTAKSPLDCFSERYIDNDLDLVSKAIDAYNDGE